MTKPQDIVAEIEALPMFRKSTTVGYQEWDWVHRPTVLALVRAALVRTPETLDTGTCWFCKGEFVVDALIAGYDTWEESRLACLACNERMSGNWQPLAASPAPDPGAADWRHFLGWLDLPDGATLGEVEAAALGLGRHQGQAPCRDEEHVLRPDPP